MNKSLLIISVVFAIVIIGYVSMRGLGQNNSNPAPTPDPVACTAEAKLCPDGSSVGRTGPNCEFAECPEAKPQGILPYKTGVRGQVLLGPTCPVMRIPPDPACTDKPYQTTVQVFRQGAKSTTPFSSTQTDKDGNFTLTLSPGEYTLEAVGGKTFPSCSPTDISINPDIAMMTQNIYCDTGIR